MRRRRKVMRCGRKAAHCTTRQSECSLPTGESKTHHSANRKISRSRICLSDERRAGEIQRQGHRGMACVTAPLQIEAQPTRDTRRPATVDALALALLRALPAPFAARLCGGGDSLGRSSVKRRLAPMRAMHGLRKQRRDAPASKLGGRACRISAVSRIGRKSLAACISRRALNLPIRPWHDAGKREPEHTKHAARSCRRCSSPPTRCL